MLSELMKRLREKKPADLMVIKIGPRDDQGDVPARDEWEAGREDEAREHNLPEDEAGELAEDHMEEDENYYEKVDDVIKDPDSKIGAVKRLMCALRELMKP